MNGIWQEKTSKKQVWAGRVFTGLLTAALLGSATAKIVGAGAMVDGLTHAGIPRGAIGPIAVLELACLALYLVPRTKLLGMLLLTGFFGGAVVTHIIGRENFFPLLMIGFCVWAGAYLQLPALRRLLPMAETAERSNCRESERAAPALGRAR
jgi:hypothetical protein